MLCVCVCVCVGSVGPSWVVLLSAVLCIIILMLPVSTEHSTTLSLAHYYCVVTVHQKLIAAYILGMSHSVVMLVPQLRHYQAVLSQVSIKAEIFKHSYA